MERPLTYPLAHPPAQPLDRRQLLRQLGGLGGLGAFTGLGGLGALAGCAVLPDPSLPNGQPTGDAAPTAPAAAPPAPGSVPAAPAAPVDPAWLAPPAPRELRGAWVATVANIDWPSRPGLPGAQQRAEALVLLDKAAALGLNALMLQVRSTADAIYPSALEPWSEYLTGRQGQPPDDGYDPLAFWVAEAHRRGLQLHAWFNPYRARHSSAKSPLSAQHIALRQPQLVRSYGEQLWLDPAEPGAAAHTLAVVADVLQRYDIDGVHLDDYFYPYPVRQPGAPEGVELPFPDDAPWARFQAAGGGLSRADWRRQHVDTLVQALQNMVRRTRPTAVFGISPFGLPQPSLRPPGITGFSQYDKLYADVERWMREGWMDYCAPQLYWPIDRTAQAFEVLLDTWLGLNPRGLAVWPGLFTSMVGAPRNPWPAAELLAQVQRLRQRPAASGHIHFSLIALAQNRDGLASKLRDGPYAQGALAPVLSPAGTAQTLLPGELPGAPQVAVVAPMSGAAATSWVPNAPLAHADAGSAAGTTHAAANPTASPAANPAKHPVSSGAGQAAWRLTPGPGAVVALWAIWRRQGGHWRFATQPAAQATLRADGADTLVISGVARSGHEGPRRGLRPDQPGLVHRLLD